MNWRENVVNDFEIYAFAKYPILAEIKHSFTTVARCTRR